jgi:hypothetical protein
MRPDLIFSLERLPQGFVRGNLVSNPHPSSRFVAKMPFFLIFTVGASGRPPGCIGNSCQLSTEFFLDFPAKLTQATCYLHVSVTTRSALVSQNLNGHDTVSRRLTGSGALR